MLKKILIAVYALLVIATTAIMVFAWFMWSVVFFVFYALIVPAIVIAIKDRYPDNPLYAKGAIGFFVLFIFYIFAVMYIGMWNYNDFGNGPKPTEAEHKQYELYRAECQFHLLDRNHWFLQYKRVYVSNKKVFEHPEFLGILLKDISFDRDATYRIYDEVEMVKKPNANDWDRAPVVKNLIMEIKK